MKDVSISAIADPTSGHYRILRFIASQPGGATSLACVRHLANTDAVMDMSRVTWHLFVLSHTKELRGVVSRVKRCGYQEGRKVWWYSVDQAKLREIPEFANWETVQPAQQVDAPALRRIYRCSRTRHPSMSPLNMYREILRHRDRLVSVELAALSQRRPSAVNYYLHDLHQRGILEILPEQVVRRGPYGVGGLRACRVYRLKDLDLFLRIHGRENFEDILKETPPPRRVCEIDQDRAALRVVRSALLEVRAMLQMDNPNILDVIAVCTNGIQIVDALTTPKKDTP